MDPIGLHPPPPIPISKIKFTKKKSSSNNHKHIEICLKSGGIHVGREGTYGNGPIETCVTRKTGSQYGAECWVMLHI
jgi:hypothetical protein